MKTLMWNTFRRPLALGAVAGTLISSGFGQQTQGTPANSACAAPPCATVVCGSVPCGQDGRPPSIKTGRITPPPAPLTAERQRTHDQELRYSDLFADLALYEREAQSEDAAGHAAMAAGWRGYFAKKSGLTEADAEIVKEIGKEYEQRRDEVNKAYRRAVSEARAEPHTARPSRHNTPAIAEAEDALYGLFPDTMAKLVSALGQRSFTTLDSYTIHMHDNSRKFSTHQANPGEHSNSPAAALPAGS